jgi:hypothetical protein
MLTCSDAAAIIACICFVEWGLIHLAAGILSWFYLGGVGGGSCTKGSAAGGLLNVALMAGLTDDEKAAFTNQKYPIFANRLGIQHGWNLFYAGVWSICCLVPILTKDRHAWFWGLHPYMFDWGYFMAIDWVNRGGAMGVAQTFIVSTGLFCSALSVKNVHGDEVSDAEFAICLVVPCLLFAAGLFNFVREKTCHTCMDCQLSEEEEAASA